MEENLSRSRNFINEPPYLDLYHLRLTLHYIWLRCAATQAQSVGSNPLVGPDCWYHWEVLAGCLQSLVGYRIAILQDKQ